MFRCKECGSTEFQLVVHQGFNGLVEIKANEFDEVVVVVDGQDYIADLMFMNQFAVCDGCGGIKQWEYFFPEVYKVV